VEEERSCVRGLSDLRVGRACVIILVSEHRKVSLLSVAGKRRIHHAAKKKGQANTRSTRGKGNAKKKG
jgi:hypothetical protein